MARKRSHTRGKAHEYPRGILSVTKGGYGFVQTAEGEFFIPESNMNGAFDGDVVEVSPARQERSRKALARAASSSKRREARVKRVVEHAHADLVGRYEVAEPFGVVIPEDPRIPYDIFTLLSENPNVPDGSIVRVSLTTYPSRKEAATGTIVEVLGDSDDERVPIDLLVARYKLETAFSEGALAEAADAHVDAEGALNSGYRDLRDRFVFTIDPEDAKDFDDAVSLESFVLTNEASLHAAAACGTPSWLPSLRLRAEVRGACLSGQSGAPQTPSLRDLGRKSLSSEGEAFEQPFSDADVFWRLGVHIADVSQYVPWGSAVDLDARRRATSVYLVDRVIPMLPEALSNDVCSLRPGEDRRTMTVDLLIDQAGNVVDVDVYPALIRSCARLTYDQAQSFIEKGAGVGKMLAECPQCQSVAADEQRLSCRPERVEESLPPCRPERVEESLPPCRPERVEESLPPCRPERVEESLSSCHSERSEESPRSGLPGSPLRGDPSPSAQDDRREAAQDGEGAARDGEGAAQDAKSAATRHDEDAAVWDNESAAARNGNEELAKRIRELSRIAKKRMALRKAAGGIDFNTVEAKVRLDERGVPLRVDLRKRTDATQLIEEAMIAANEAVARFLNDAGFPCIYRVHEKPSRESLAGLVPVLQEFPWFKGIDADAFVAGNPHVISQVLEACEGRNEEALVTTLALRAMKRALYEAELKPHYALASAAYAHFTSPIRRYPDLVVHRMLKAALWGRPHKFDQEVTNLVWIAQHSSHMERIAERAAAESQEVKIIELMEGQIGQTFSGMISGVASYGLFVRLDNTAEGMVEIADLGREYFALDSVRHTLTGSDSGKEYRLGKHVAVRLVGADRRTRTLRFKLVN